MMSVGLWLRLPRRNRIDQIRCCQTPLRWSRPTSDDHVEEVTKIPEFDYVVIREGKSPFPMAFWRAGCWAPPGKPCIEGEMPDLIFCPFPDRDLFLDDGESMATRSTRPKVPFVPDLPHPPDDHAGRGASITATFSSRQNGSSWPQGAQAEPGQHLTELELLRERYRFSSFMFHDVLA